MASNDLEYPKDTTIYCKGDKMLNPKTNRFVIVGGSAWKKLVREGLAVGGMKRSPVRVVANQPLHVMKTQPVKKKKTFRLKPKPEVVVHEQEEESESESDSSDCLSDSDSE